MKILIALVLLFAASPVFAAVSTYEAGMDRHTAPEDVEISTHAYTIATTTTTRSLGRDLTLVLIDNPSSNTSKMYGHIGNCTSTSISTQTIQGPIEIHPSSNSGFIHITSGECLWLCSAADNPEDIIVQGISQRK